MNYSRTQALSLPRWQLISSKTLFFAFAGILVVLFCLYAYLVNKTVMNVVAREKVEKDITALSTSLSSLEYKYITLKNGVTLNLAYSKGFTDAEPSAFLSRGGQALTYNSR